MMKNKKVPEKVDKNIFNFSETVKLEKSVR